MAEVRRGAFEAAPNIALVKYWGQRDEANALPYNSSLSVTLARFRTRTVVAFDPCLPTDRVTLNGRPALAAPRDAVKTFLDRVRALSGTRTHADVRSRNNFPTASGLASSASGFAALAGAASTAAGLRLSSRRLSQLARFGSGSAARSVFGGFVEWQRGDRPDGRDCYARPLFGPDHWADLVDLVCLVERAPVKTIRSATAMQQTVRTSPEFARRQDEVPDRLTKIRRAIRDRDAGRLFPLVMEECDSFRTVCETTRPSLDYLTAASRLLLRAVREENARAGRPVAAYTHDAGAHVHIFTLVSTAAAVRRRLSKLRGVRQVTTTRPGPGARRLSDHHAI